MATKNTLVRKDIDLGKKRIPLKKLFHGKEIRVAAKALEDFRLHFNEQEILYGAKLTVCVDPYGEVYLTAKRPESDNEYKDRLEKARAAKELSEERARKRKEAAHKKAIEDAANKQINALETIRSLAKVNGLTSEQLQTLLELK